jgi:hypothetical protein
LTGNRLQEIESAYCLSARPSAAYFHNREHLAVPGFFLTACVNPSNNKSLRCRLRVECHTPGERTKFPASDDFSLFWVRAGCLKHLTSNKESERKFHRRACVTFSRFFYCARGPEANGTARYLIAFKLFPLERANTSLGAAITT